ncbi:7074_t:CDS:2, partial [Rhizophagus irregularis]
SISLDGNYIASFNILNETVSLWSRPTNSFNLDEKVLIGNCEIDIKKMIDISQEKFDGKFGLTVSTKMLPYNYLQFKGIFIILFYQPEENESEEVKPIILYKEHKDIKRLEYSYPVCLKSVKGIAKFLVDGMTLVVKNKTTFYVVSISSWPWTLIRKLNHVNIAESIITFNPSTFKSYILLPQCSKKFLSMINVRAAKSCVGYKMIISSKGDLLAFENGSIIERQTGLNIARHNVADMKDFAFVHDDRHLLKICFNELSMSATLIDARSGIKLATVMLPKLESDYLKHIRLIKDGRIIAVILQSGFSSLVVEEWNWEKAFCIQSTKYLNSFTYNNIYWPDNLINSYEITNKSLKKKALSIHNDKENYSLVFSCYNVKCPTGAIFFHLDEESAIMVTPDCIFLFWEKDGILSAWYDNKKLYTLLPLDLVIEGQSLTAEWMQSSCHYIEQQKSNNISQIHLLTIKQYIKCNAFNNTMAIYDLINCNADEIVREILKYDHYIPTIVCYKKNPLIKAIKMHKTSLTQQIIDYCWHQCSNKDEPGFMSVVVDVLPQLATQYPHMLSTLLKQLTFAKIPTSWEINKPKKDKSSYKNLWTHKLDGSISFGINEDYETNDMLMVIIINNPYSTRFCPSIDGSLVGNPNSGMKFYQSLKNAWLMLLNDYSSLDSQTENYLSDILKITFSFSTTIIIFNILIALMNNTYKKIYKNARTAWVMQRAEVIVNIEILLIHYFNCKLFYGDCFPWSIIYKALTEEVDEWSKEKGNIQTTDEAHTHQQEATSAVGQTWGFWDSGYHI